MLEHHSMAGAACGRFLRFRDDGLGISRGHDGVSSNAPVCIVRRAGGIARAEIRKSSSCYLVARRDDSDLVDCGRPGSIQSN